MIAAAWSQWHGAVITQQDKARGKLWKPLNTAFSEQLCHRHLRGSGK